MPTPKPDQLPPTPPPLPAAPFLPEGGPAEENITVPKAELQSILDDVNSLRDRLTAFIGEMEGVEEPMPEGEPPPPPLRKGRKELTPEAKAQSESLSEEIGMMGGGMGGMR